MWGNQEKGKLDEWLRSHEDILGKAMRGLGIGKNEMAQRLGVSQVEAILNGGVDENLINAIAGELQLDGVKLIRSAKKVWQPSAIEIVGLKQISITYGNMIVNAYVIWNAITRNAWILTSEQTLSQFWP